MPGGDAARLQYMQNMQGAMAGQAPLLNQSIANQARGDAQGWGGQQQQLAQMLFGAAMGNGPSAAQAQLQQGTDANIRNAMAMGQSMGGANNMAAYRNILGNQAMAQQQGANQAAQLRAQEQQGAMGMLGNVLQGARGQSLETRGQDLGAAGQNSQLQQNQFGLNNQAGQGWANLSNQLASGQLQGNIAQQQLAQQSYQNQQNRQAGVVGGVLGGIGSALGLASGGEVPPIGLMPLGDMGQADSGGFQQGLGMWSGKGGGGGGAAGAGLQSGMMGLAAKAGMMGMFANGGQVPCPPFGLAFGGDNPANDTVPAMLSPGEIVLPRSVTQDEHAEEKAAMFVAAIKARHRSAHGRGRGQ